MSKKIDFYKDLHPFLTCKDHTVSQEDYQLSYQSDFEMLVTTPFPNNLAKYYKSEDYISHTDANKTLFEKVYQRVRNITLKQKLNLINKLSGSSKRLLDVGAGTADFLKYCQNNNWEVLGVEPSEAARNIAKKKGVELYKHLNQVRDQKFDVITLWHVLEHVENLEDYIHQLHELLEKDGRLIVAVPNFKSYDAHKYGSYWAAYDVPRHLWHFSRNSISKLFALTGMEVEKILPMKFDAYYVALLSEKYKNGKMNPMSAFWTGFVSNWKAKQTKEYSSLIYILKNK